MRKTHECHKCPHNMKRHTDCLQCPGPSDTPHNDGVCMVDIEMACNEYRQLIGQCSVDETSILAELMRIWIRSTPIEREAIAIHITQPELSYAEIGRMLGRTRAAISKAIHQCDINVHDLRNVTVAMEKPNDQLTIGL